MYDVTMLRDKIPLVYRTLEWHCEASVYELIPLLSCTLDWQMYSSHVLCDRTFRHHT